MSAVVERDLHVPTGTWGLLISGAWLVSLPFRFLAGSLIVRYSRHVLAAAYFVSAVALIGTANAPNKAMVSLALALYASANGVMNVGVNAAGIHYEKRTNTQILGNLHAGFSLGGAVSTLVVGALLSLGWTATSLSLLLAGFLAFCVLAFRNLVSDVAEDVPQQKLALIDRDLFAIPGFMTVALIGAIAAAAEAGMYLWTIIYMRDEFSLEGIASVAGTAAFFAAMAVGRFGFNPVVRRLGRLRSLQYSGVLIAAAMTVGLLTNSAALAALSFLVVGLGCAIAVPVSISLLGALAPDRSAAVASFGTALISIALVASPLIVGTLAGLISLRVALGMIAVCGALCALLSYRVRERAAG